MSSVPLVTEIAPEALSVENVVEASSLAMRTRLTKVKEEQKAIDDEFHSANSEYTKSYEEFQSLQEALDAINYDADPKVIDGQTITPSYEASRVRKQMDSLREKRRTLEKAFYSKEDPLNAEYRSIIDQLKKEEVGSFRKNFVDTLPDLNVSSDDLVKKVEVMRKSSSGRLLEGAYSSRESVLIDAKAVMKSDLPAVEKLRLLTLISQSVESSVLGTEASDMLRFYKEELSV